MPWISKYAGRGLMGHFSKYRTIIIKPLGNKNQANQWMVLTLQSTPVSIYSFQLYTKTKHKGFHSQSFSKGKRISPKAAFSGYIPTHIHIQSLSHSLALANHMLTHSLQCRLPD